jgi:hypothetical protein
MNLTDKNLSISVIKQNLSSLSKKDWHILSKNHELTDSFMKNFLKYIEWYFVELRDDLTEEFVRKYIDNLDLLVVLICNDFSKQFEKEIKKKLHISRQKSKSDIKKKRKSKSNTKSKRKVTKLND